MIRTGVRIVEKAHILALRRFAFKSPLEYLESNVQAKAAHEQFEESILAQPFDHKPQMLTSHDLDPVTKRPIPVNVEVLKYQPLRHPRTHGHLVSILTFKSYHNENIARAAEFAARAAYYLGIPATGVHALKTEKRLYTVIKSPFAQAKTKQNFHRVTYGLQLKAFDACSETVDLWLAYINKYKLVDVEYSAQLYTREPLDFIDVIDSIQEFSMPLGMSNVNNPIVRKVEELIKSDAFKELLKE